MRRLLCANFSRLGKDMLFWSGVAVMALFSLYWVSQNPAGEPADSMFFYHTLILPFALAAICALFIGTEYSDGTLRNKIVAGHTRSHVYFANQITCLAAGAALGLTSVFIIAALGAPLFGFEKDGTTRLICFMSLSFLNMAAFASLFTLMGMLIQNKSSASVALLMSLVAIFALAVALNMRLEQPEFLRGSGAETTPNPAYMTGMPRQVSEILFDALPSGQAINLFQMKAPDPVRMAACSLSEILISTLLGVLVFRKRDIR
ncbi:MAG: ABC transporter permease subunit [Clostridia bacterium]|nr:ABC transporter permease subunit [Clostridia bacterium]